MSPVDPRARARLEAICERVRKGTPVSHACVLEGVAKSSLYKLRHEDEAVDLALSSAQAASAEMQRKRIVRIAKGGLPGANANVLLHLLERSCPDEYAPPKQRTEVSGPEGGAQKHEHSGSISVPLEDLKRIARSKETP